MDTERMSELTMYNSLVADTLRGLAEINMRDGYIGILSPKAVSPYMWIVLGYAQACFGVEIKFYCGPIEMFFLRRKHPNIKIEKLKKSANLDIYTFLTKIAEKYDQNIEVFEKVYDEFYKND